MLRFQWNSPNYPDAFCFSCRKRFVPTELAAKEKTSCFSIHLVNKSEVLDRINKMAVVITHPLPAKPCFIHLGCLVERVALGVINNCLCCQEPTRDLILRITDKHLSIKTEQLVRKVASKLQRRSQFSVPTFYTAPMMWGNTYLDNQYPIYPAPFSKRRIDTPIQELTGRVSPGRESSPPLLERKTDSPLNFI